MKRRTLPGRAGAAVVAFILPLLLLGMTIANWVAVDQAVGAALRHNPEHEHVFIETYGSGARAVLLVSALLQLLIAVALMSVRVSALKGRRSGKAFAITLPWFTICCGLGALTMNPVTKVRWVGEPDGLSLVEDYFPAWNWPVQCVLLVLTGLCCVTTTIIFATTRSVEYR